jgi:hypothetical protein
MGFKLIDSCVRAAELIRTRSTGYFSWSAIDDDHGVLRSVSSMTPYRKMLIASARNYRARAEIALDVASNYPGGDYFEFGAGSLNSFRTFLAAFQLNGLTNRFPDSRFYAFDIFGNPDHGGGPPPEDRHYFEHWRNPPEIAAPVATLNRYRDLKNRCVIVPGYFQETLTDEFKAMMRREKRKIGFAFLDVNIASSYKFCFDFLLDVMTPERMFIEIDEYFEEHNPSIHPLYQDFAAEAKERYNLDSLYMRNAGGFGALFCLMPGRATLAASQ